MSQAISIPTPSRLPAKLRKKLEGAFRQWLDRQEHHTQKLYERGLVHFAQWLEVEEVLELAPEPEEDKAQRLAWKNDVMAAGGRYLVGLKEPEAILLVETYLYDNLYGEGEVLARATMATRLAALRWATKEARRFGHIKWDLSLVKMPKKRKTKDGKLQGKRGRNMRGPTRQQAKELLKVAAKDEDPRALLLLHMTRYEGYREHEIRQIDLEDIDFERGTVMLIRKKRGEPSPFPLSKPTLKIIKAWLKIRGKRAGPLFTGGVHGTDLETRIGSRTIRDIIYRVAETAKVSPCSPHRIRHRACTDIVLEGVKQGLPEEELLYLTGHTNRSALRPYYEAEGDVRPRAVLDAIAAT